MLMCATIFRIQEGEFGPKPPKRALRRSHCLLLRDWLGSYQENRKFAFSAFPSRISGKKRKKQGNYGIVKQDPRRSSAKSMKSSARFS